MTRELDLALARAEEAERALSRCVAENLELERRLKPAKEEKMQRILGTLYHYDNGQGAVEFVRGGRRDWYVWSARRQQRLATYRTRRELLAAYARSDNREGAYGCALLRLVADEDEAEAAR